MQQLIPIPDSIVQKGLHLKNNALIAYINMFEPEGFGAVSISLIKIESDEFPIRKNFQKLAKSCQFCIITGFNVVDYLCVYNQAVDLAREKGIGL